MTPTVVCSGSRISIGERENPALSAKYERSDSRNRELSKAGVNRVSSVGQTTWFLPAESPHEEKRARIHRLAVIFAVNK
jgi:hypothetical protein